MFAEPVRAWEKGRASTDLRIHFNPYHFILINIFCTPVLLVNLHLGIPDQIRLELLKKERTFSIFGRHGSVNPRVFPEPE